VGDEIFHVMTACHSAKYFVFRRENDVCAYTLIQKLEGKINVKLHDIINKLYTEAVNVILAEDFARQTILERPVQRDPEYLHNIKKLE